MLEQSKTKSVLIVDDNVQNRKIISSYLKRDNFSVFEAQSAEDAFSFLGIVVPDAILMDYQMPGLDGLKAIELIREKNLKSVIIMMTAYTSQEVVIGAIRSQADDFLSKPLNFKDLGRLINNTIEKRLSTYSIHSLEGDDNVEEEEELFSNIICVKNGNIMLNYSTSEETIDEVDDKVLENFTNLLNSPSMNKTNSIINSNSLDIAIGSLHFIIKKDGPYQIYFILNENQYHWALEYEFLDVFHDLINELFNKCLDLSDSDDKSILLTNVIEDKLLSIIDNMPTQ